MKALISNQEFTLVDIGGRWYCVKNLEHKPLTQTPQPQMIKPDDWSRPFIVGASLLGALFTVLLFPLVGLAIGIMALTTRSTR